MSKIGQRLEQKQKLNPKQIIEANLMQLNLGSLEKRILEEVESNPTLDIVENELDHDSQEDRGQRGTYGGRNTVRRARAGIDRRVYCFNGHAAQRRRDRAQGHPHW